MSLPAQHLLDRLATSYIGAIAATASANVYKGELDYGVDGTVERVIKAKRNNSPGYKYITDGFMVAYQLKATTRAVIKEDHVVYDLDARAFQMIATRSPRAVPLYLFLVCFGVEQSGWMTVDGEQLTLRASAYWWRTIGPAPKNKSSVSIKVPRENVLSGASVAAFLQEAEDLIPNART